MKKIYIQPSITVGSMNPFEMIAGGESWKIKTDNWDGGTGPGFGGSTKPKPGEGNDFAAKRRGFYSSYGDEAEW